MIEGLFFSVEVQLKKTVLENYMREKLGFERFLWVDNFYEFYVENEIDDKTACIELNVHPQGEGFKYGYGIFNKELSVLTLSQKTHLMKELASREYINILSSDDEINPWTWVLTEPDGSITSVETNDEGTIIEGYYNFPFGDFRSRNKLNEENLNLLKNIITGLYPDIKIEYAMDGPVINGAFNKVKQDFKTLAGFIHHYEILPGGKNIWLDKEDKSASLISYMTEFHKQTGVDFCVFPSNYREIKGIEGGSDSEEHCILISNKGPEKIVYKLRRKSWLK